MTKRNINKMVYENTLKGLMELKVVADVLDIAPKYRDALSTAIIEFKKAVEEERNLKIE